MARRPTTSDEALVDLFLDMQAAERGAGNNTLDAYRNDLADLHRNNVKVRIIGLRRNLSADLRALLNEAEELTRGNSGLTLVVALNQ